MVVVEHITAFFERLVVGTALIGRMVRCRIVVVQMNSLCKC